MLYLHELVQEDKAGPPWMSWCNLPIHKPLNIACINQIPALSKRSEVTKNSCCHFLEVRLITNRAHQI